MYPEFNKCAYIPFKFKILIVNNKLNIKVKRR